MGMTLDEITNTYITEVLINRILSFKKYKIESPILRSYLNSIQTSQPDGKYRAIGYHSEVRLLYPLLLNEMFLNLVNQHQFDGEVDIIKTFIDGNTDICDYRTFCQLLDSIYSGNCQYPNEVKRNNVEFVQKHIRDIHHAQKIVLDITEHIGGKALVKK